MRLTPIAFCLGVWWLQQQPELPPARWLWLLPLPLSLLWLPVFSHAVAAFTRPARTPLLRRSQRTRSGPRGAAQRVARVQAGERWQLTVRVKMPYGTSNPHGFDLEAWMLERGINASGYVRETPAPQRLAALAATPAGWIAATRAQ